MRWLIPFAAGVLGGAVLHGIVATTLPQHNITIALGACFTEGDPHPVTRLAWDIWATNPHKYPIDAPLFFMTKMSPLGLDAKYCMWEQLDEADFNARARGQGA